MKTLIEEIRTEIERISPAHLENKFNYYNEDWLTHFIDIAGSVPIELKEFWKYCDFEIWLSGNIYKQLNAEENESKFSILTVEQACQKWELLSIAKNRAEIKEHFLNQDPAYLKNRGFEEEIIYKTFFADFWFPFAEDSNGSYICIDNLPGANGKTGQLLYLLYGGENAYGPYYAKLTSFEDLLKRYLNSLKTSNYEIGEEGIIYEC